MRGEHGHDLEAHVLLHGQPEVPEGGDDLGDLLHHGAHVLPQLVHGDGPPHHGGQAGLQRHQVGRHLNIMDVVDTVDKVDTLGTVDTLDMRI